MYLWFRLLNFIIGNGLISGLNISAELNKFLKDVNVEAGEMDYVWPSLIKQYDQFHHCKTRDAYSIYDPYEQAKSIDQDPPNSTTIACPQYQDLVRYLLSQDKVSNMPDIKTSLYIGMSVELYKITSLDLEKGLIRTAGRWMFFWKDERLAYRGDLWFPKWNSATDYVVVPSGPRGYQNIWYPHIVPARSVEENWHEHGAEYMRPRIYDERFLKVRMDAKLVSESIDRQKGTMLFGPELYRHLLIVASGWKLFRSICKFVLSFLKTPRTHLSDCVPL